MKNKILLIIIIFCFGIAASNAEKYIHNWSGKKGTFKTKNGSVTYNKGWQIRTDHGGSGSITVEVSNNDDGSDPIGIMVTPYWDDEEGNRHYGQSMFFPGKDLPWAEGFPDPNPKKSYYVLNNDDYCNIYPNPASNEVFIDFKSSEMDVSSIEIIDFLGNQKSTVLNNAQSITTCNIEHLEKGVFFVRFSIGDIFYVKKLVKE